MPLPPLEVQQAIVAEIEKERALVEGNKTLIALMQEKIRTVIESVWSA
jgi:type I restriction enzyme M protein